MSVRRVLFVPAALALGAALSLTACQSGGGSGGAQQSAKPTQAAPAGSAPTAGTVAAPLAGTSAAPVSGASATPAANGAPGRAESPAAPAAPGGGGGDSYAYSHPCESKKLSVRVTSRAGAPSQRVIEVRNQGTTACGLGYYPLLSLGDSHSADRGKDVRPLVPSGLGGAPAYPVAPGRTAYAVLDLNPGGAGSGTVSGVDEVNVLADGDHMPVAETLNFPLGQGAKVLRPKLGLYRDSVADAAASAATADRQS